MIYILLHQTYTDTIEIDIVCEKTMCISGYYYPIFLKRLKENDIYILCQN